MVQGLLGGEKERTEARLRAALDGLQMAVGNDDASTANAMTNLALFLKGDGQHAEATELYTTVLAIRCRLAGCACMHACMRPKIGLHSLARIRRPFFISSHFLFVSAESQDEYVRCASTVPLFFAGEPVDF